MVRAALKAAIALFKLSVLSPVGNSSHAVPRMYCAFAQSVEPGTASPSVSWATSIARCRFAATFPTRAKIKANARLVRLKIARLERVGLLIWPDGFVGLVGLIPVVALHR